MRPILLRLALVQVTVCVGRPRELTLITDAREGATAATATPSK